MKHKLFTFLIAVMASFGSLFAQSGTCGDNLTWNLTDGVLTISGTGAMENYTSSSYHRAPWYYNRSSIKTVVIDDGVTSIGDNAFYNCSSLTSVHISNLVAWCAISFSDTYSNPLYYAHNLYLNGTLVTDLVIPNGVTNIGSYAFYFCRSLTSVTIPNSVTSIGDNAFTGCSSLPVEDNLRYADTYLVEAVDHTLSSYTIKEGTKWIGSNAFSGCRSLTSVTIPNSVTSIGKYAFYNCSSLTSVEIPNSVISIGKYAFEECTGLTSVTIPNSVTSIGEYAFKECTGLTSVTINSQNIVGQVYTSLSSFKYIFGSQVTEYIIGDEVTSIGDNAFYDCNGLTSVTIPNSVTSIGNGAFYNCSNLTSVEITNSVTSIGEYAFYNCRSLTSVTIPNSVTSIGDNAFRECGNLTSVTIGNSVTSIGGYAFYNCSNLTSATIPNSVTSIGDYAFTSCGSLTSVTIGNNVTSIGSDAFLYCSSLTSVTLNSNTIVSKNYTSSSTIVSIFYSQVTEYIIGDSVTSIGDWAFYRSWDLTSVTIPNSVTSIGEHAFSECSSLPSVTIPNSVTSIGESAFSSCDSLTSIEIPNSVTSIGNYAFSSCSGLTTVTIPNSVTSIENWAFSYCNSLTSITNHATTPQVINTNVFNGVNKSTCMLYVPAESIAAYQAADVWKEFGNILPIEDTPEPCLIASGICGAQGDNLTWELSCDSVLTISGTGAMADYEWNKAPWFSNAANIVSVEISEGITSVGQYAFSGCSGLISVTIPNSITSIGAYAFSGCSGLISVAIPNSVTSIGWGAFLRCIGLTSIDVAADNTNYSSVEGVLFNKNQTSLLQYPSGKQSAYTIPNNVTSIRFWAFSGCTGLTSVVIPNSVTSIGSQAFEGCSGLTSVTNYATTPQVINANVFNGVNKSTCMLYVPAESIAAYQAADVWKEFGNILAIEDEPAPCITASGTCGAQGDNLTWTLTCDSVLTISGTGAMAQGTPWSNYMSEIKSLIITNGVTSIGDGTFEHCDGLISIEIPNSVTSIGSRAFWSCNSLTSVTIPNSVTSIGASVFNWCDNLTSIIVENGNLVYDSRNNCNAIIEKVSNTLITGCKNTIIPNSVTAIGFQAFNGCRGLTFIEIPNSVVSIGNFAFSGCNGLTSVTIPNSVTSIGDYAFSRCSGLTSIEIPSSVTSIEGGAFYGCSRMTSINAAVDNPSYCSVDGVLFNKDITTLVQYPGGKRGAYTIPSSVTSIGDNAFLECQVLTSIEIPHSVTNIGYAAFCWCTQLSTITIPSSVTNIENEAFQTCHNLTSITNYATTPQAINANVFNGVNKSTCMLYVPAESIAAYQTADVWKEFGNILAIDDSTEEVNYATLADIYNMAADSTFTLGAFDVMYVPDFQSGSNMYIKDSTGSCVIYKVNYGLQAGDHVEAGLQGKVSIYNGLHEVIPITAKEDLIITHGEAPAPIVATEAPSLNNASQYVVYEGVSFTTDTAFVEGRRHTVYGSWNGQTITFYNQYYIGATLSANKTYNITAVNTIYRTTPQAYPLVVEEVSPAPCIIASGTCGAQGDNLTWTLSCDSVLTISGTGAMDDYYSYESIPWYEYIYTANSIKSVIIQEGVTHIGQYAFRNCHLLASVSLANSLTSIGGGAFSYCGKLPYVKIPSSVTNLGIGVFEGCSSMSAFEVSEANPNFCSVDGVLFDKNISTLMQYPPSKTNTTYSIPSNVVTIAETAFWCSRNLTIVTIPNSVTSIGDGAFMGCTGLTSVTIGNSVTRIGDYAFDGCTGLTTITNYAATPQTISSYVFTNVNISSCTLYVPAQSVAAYQAADVWKDFGTILPIDGTVEVEVDTITVAQALEIGSTLAANVSTDKQYTIRGYVSAITTPFSEQYLNQTFYIADDSLSTASSNAEGGFYVYRGKPITGQPIKEGALVELTTAIKNYNNRTIENAEQNVLVTVLKEGPECRILSGTCGAEGDNLTWTLTCDSVLTISGTGAMADFEESTNKAPWASLRYAIRSTIIENGVTNIGNFAFHYNTTTSVTIPNSVTQIGHGAFYGCDYLNSIIIPNSVTAIEGSAFRYCRALTSVSIPNSVLTIGYDAFEYCDNLETVYIPSSVISIGNSAFAGNKKMRSINVDEANLYYCSIDGVLFNKDQTKLLQYPNGKGDTLYIIPNTVTTLGSMSFSYILKKDSVKLTSIVIPNSVTTINANAFWDANNLASITNYAVTPQWVSAPYANISSCTLYVPAQSLEAYQAADFWKDFANILPIEGTETPIETVESNYTIYYVDKADQYLTDETVTLHVPVAPVIEGFTFVEWRVAEGSLSFGITIQAIYEANEPTSAPEVYTNPATPAQKLIRNGNVYILTDDKIYSITGKTVR